MKTNNPYQLAINLSQLSDNLPLWHWWQHQHWWKHLVMIKFMLIVLINVSIYPPLTSMAKVSPFGAAPPDWTLLGDAPIVYLPMIFICVYKPLITLFPFIWIISPPLTKGITLKSYHSFFPCDNCSPWKHASMLSLQAFTFASDKSVPLCPIYGASSCTSKTYKIRIQKNSFWSRNYS